MRFKRLFVITLVLMLTLTGVFVGCTNDNNNGGNGEGEIPNFDFKFTSKLHNISIRDPFIYTHEKYGIYYMYGTSGNPASADGMGFSVYKSKNLVDWAGPYSAVRADALGEDVFKKDFWAPEVFKVGEKYYMLGTVSSDSKSRYTQIFVTDDLEKEFVPHGRATPEGKGAIDATLYFEGDKIYSIFCEEWITRPDRIGTMNIVEMTSDLKNVKPETERVLFKSTDAKVAADGVTDGPFLYKSSLGELYMIWSTFNKGTYNLLYARSQNGSVDGSTHGIADRDLFEHFAQPLYSGDGGHGMIFVDLDGELRIVFHTPNLPPERATIYSLDDTEQGSLSLIEWPA